MNEAHFAEIEKTMLYISGARARAERAAEAELAALHKRLLQRTYFAVPKAQLSL